MGKANKKMGATRALLGALCLCGALGAQAALVVDRGLPDANLNNASGGDRSNVAWDFFPCGWLYLR